MHHYYAILQHFEMEPEVIELQGNLTIRQIEDKELDQVRARAGDLFAYPLAYILTTDTEQTFADIDNQFEYVINAFRIFKHGNTGINMIFGEPIEGRGIGIVRLVNARIVVGGPMYKLSNDEVREFKRFYKHLHKLANKIKALEFLNVAIRRFSSSIEHPFAEDKVIDSMIALEALYSTDSQELRYRISKRISALLGKNENDRKYLDKFVQKAYDARSQLVHGKPARSINVKGRTFNIEQLSAELESLARLSVRKFLNLTTHYNDQESILCDLDEHIIRSVRKKGIITKAKGIFDYK